MKALLIDGLNIIRRIYAAVPENKPGHPSGHIQRVVSSSSASIKRALHQHGPSHCVVVLEAGGQNWRHEIYPDYKKNRRPMPGELKQALPEFNRHFERLGIAVLTLPGFEADDILATLATKIQKRHGRSVILSTDRLHCQLLSPGIEVYDHFAQRALDHGVVQLKYRVEPSRIPDVLALAGDSGLSIPGVRSVGVRIAARLVNEHGGLESVLAAADAMPGKLGQTLKSSGEEARTAFRLFLLKTDIQLGINLKELRYRP